MCLCFFILKFILFIRTAQISFQFLRFQTFTLFTVYVVKQYYLRNNKRGELEKLYSGISDHVFLIFSWNFNKREFRESLKNNILHFFSGTLSPNLDSGKEFSSTAEARTGSGFGIEEETGFGRTGNQKAQRNNKGEYET